MRQNHFNHRQTRQQKKHIYPKIMDKTACKTKKMKILESTDRKQSTNHFMYLLNRQTEYSNLINRTAVPSSGNTKIVPSGLNQPQRYLFDRLNYTTIDEPFGPLLTV